MRTQRITFNMLLAEKKNITDRIFNFEQSFLGISPSIEMLRNRLHDEYRELANLVIEQDYEEQMLDTLSYANIGEDLLIDLLENSLKSKPPIMLDYN